jgi:hypothetical protein
MRTHTGPRFIVSSEGRESHQPHVIRASHMNSKILVLEPGREPRTYRIGVGRATTAPLALSLCNTCTSSLPTDRSQFIKSKHKHPKHLATECTSCMLIVGLLYTCNTMYKFFAYTLFTVLQKQTKTPPNMPVTQTLRPIITLDA